MIEAMHPYRPHSHHEDARLLTKDLRTSDEPSWNAVREHLIDAGFDPQESAVGDLFPEQPGDFGVLVTADRRVFTFEVGQESVRGQRGTSRWWVSLDERVDARSRFAYASAAFAAMTLLEKERPSDVPPLDVLVEYVAELTRKFRDTEERDWGDRWTPEDYWDVLHAFLREHSIDPLETVELARAWTGSETDGGLMDAQGRCYHYTASLETIHGPIREVTTWDELDVAEARSIYGDLVDAGLELQRRAHTD